MVTLSWRSCANSSLPAFIRLDQGETAFLTRTNLQYVIKKDKNNFWPSYPEVVGISVKTYLLLGYYIRFNPIIFPNLSKVFGIDVQCILSPILKGTVSYNFLLFYSFIDFFIICFTLSVYFKYTSYFPINSRSDIVYLKQAYPRPRYLIYVTFAIQTVFISFNAFNFIVFSQYLFHINQYKATFWEPKHIPITGYTIPVLFFVFYPYFSFYFSNNIGIIKLLIQIFVTMIGFVILDRNIFIQNLTLNFFNIFYSSSLIV